MTQRTHPPDTVSADRNDLRTVLTIQGRQVREEANRLTEQLAAGGGGPGSRILLDLGTVDYVSSEDLGALIALHKRVKGNGGRLTLLNVRPLVSGVLSVTRLDTLFDVRQAG